MAGEVPRRSQDNMYEVTVQATDADRRMGTKPVTVEVTNVGRAGGGDPLSPAADGVGVLLTATASPTPMVISQPRTMAVAEGWLLTFPDADGETYTRPDSDIGSYLRATVTYKDPESRQVPIPRGQMSGRTMLCCGPHPVTMPLSSLMTRTLSWPKTSARSGKEE